MNLFDGICGKVAAGLCRLSVSGGIAVKTRSGYRTWDPEKKRLINCDCFVLDAGEDFFFVLPANRVKPGDIILSGGSPRCVLSVGENTISAINYEDATVETLLPEHHIFMGSTYLYGKIVSVFGQNGVRGKKGAGRMMKYMMFSSMLRGKEGGREGGLSAMLPLLLGMKGDFDFMGDLFEEEDDEPDEKTEEKGA